METKIRVLIVDFNSEFCRLLSEQMRESEDMEVVGTAADGLDALRLTAELKPDVLLTELMLPRLDGLELLRRLPETGAEPRVIVLTGFFNAKVVADCSALGADYFMPKPCASTRSACPPTSRATSICGRRSSSRSRTWR